MSNFETTIQTYLENRAKTDSLFAETYKKANKSIKECCKYIYSQARKLAKGSNSVGIDDATVYGWAVHYYDEDDIVQITTTLDKYLFKVTWNEELGAWCLMMKGDIKEGTKPLGEWLGEYWDKIEVIGNIYDNPELMEEWI